MKRQKITFAALATLLIGSAIGSCDKDKTPSALIATRSVQEQQASPTLPSGGMPGTEEGMMDMSRLRAGCPMVVQGADVAVVDTDGGIALTFTTGTGDIADLRTRVRSMAQMYEMQHWKTGMMWHPMGGEAMGHGGHGMGGEGMGHMAERGPMPAVSNTVSDTEKGTRLELRPTNPSQLDALREHVRRHQERMHAGECWMSKGQFTATPRREQE